MKRILFAFTMLAFAVSALPQARGADVSVDFFYDNLSGGNWIDVEGYGYGWQPDLGVSDPNWRPYADGYWAYTDYGWTWISYEDFGWATYHYGRWANLADYGWVWFPGSDLDWGPAWVSWRTGGDYIGWAPLPPRGPGVVYEGQPIGGNVDIVFDIGPEYYNFCDVRFIGEPVLRDRIFPQVQNVTYIANTVNVTNITVQNNVVYNYGPNFNTVNQYSSRPIQRLTIERETPGNLSAAVKSGTLTKVQGNKLLIAAPPRFAKAPPTVKPPAVKAKVAQPKIEHGWKGVSNRAELEQRIKSENPKNIPPPTRAVAREGGSPGPAAGTNPAGVAGSPAASPGPRGKRGRLEPGATSAPSLGVSPSPVERGKGRAAGRARPGATAMPGEGTTGVSPSPFERAKPGGRGRPGITPPPSAPREGVSPTPFDRGKGRVKPGERSPAPGGQAGAAKSTQPSALQGTPLQPERGRSPARRQRGEPGPGQGESEQNSPQERIRFGTPAPMATGEHGQRGGGQPSGFRQPVTPPSGGGPADQARSQKERMQNAHAQPPPPPQRGGQAQGQPEGGKRKPAKETPSPGPR
ncbi:MAG TPA: DUF6600 domain-containing protein [Candidatus Udaeobacter sp.]|jgi:hypothetical protein